MRLPRLGLDAEEFNGLQENEEKDVECSEESGPRVQNEARMILPDPHAA
jgi:hypothetical protein